MATTDLVSVIVPARNAGRYIRWTIASALAQSHRDLEVVVVDDGSTDDTAALLAAAAARDARVRVLHGPRRGVAAARNQAIAAARGALIAPLDADDVWHPEKLRRQVATLAAAGPEVGVVYCWSIGIDADNGVVVPSWSRNVDRGDVADALAVGNILGNASTPLIRRTCLEAVGGYDDGLRAAGAEGAEDWALYLALAAVCRFEVVPEYLVGYRLSDGAMSADTARMERSIALVARQLRAQRPELPAALLRRQRQRAQAYLSFLALRRGDVRGALRHRARAWAAHPPSLVGAATIRFAGQVLRRATGRACDPMPAQPLFREIDGRLQWTAPAAAGST